MGLAASQGRYLCLTARNSDLVYEGQQISQQRMALAQETQEIANRYNDAMSNTIMTCIVPGQDSQRLTYDVITNQDSLQGLAMRIVDVNGAVVVPAEYIEVSKYDDENNLQSSEKITSVTDFIARYMPDLDEEEKLNLMFKSLSDVNEYFKSTYSIPDDLNIKTVHSSKKFNEFIGKNEKVINDEFITDPEYLQEMLVTGQYFIQKPEPNGTWKDYEWQASNVIAQEYNTADDAAAEAAYEAAMVDIQKKDKILELRLEQVQTQQQAVSKEMESVKNIINKNVEDTFKTFA